MISDSPLFSVIIPTFNRAEKLRRALESLEAQTFRDFEVIVCDDGSTDDTRSAVESFSERMPVTYLWEENFGGPGRPRNNGIRVSRGEWLCFLDADDWWYPEKLNLVRTHLATADIVYHDLDRYPRRLWRPDNTFRARAVANPVFVDLMLKGNALPNSSVVVRREIVVAAGGVSEEKSLVAAEDFDLWLKIARITERFTHIPQVLGAYWVGDGNISEPSHAQVCRVETIYEKHAPYLAPEEQAQSKLLFCFMIANIKYKIGLRDEALSLLRLTLATDDFSLKMRALVMLLYIRGVSFFAR